MKTINDRLFGKIKRTFVLSVMLIAVFAFLSDANAQGRRGGMGRGSGRSSMHFPSHSMGFFNGRHGIHYAPRIGTRISILPFGYSTFWLNGFEYYYYDGFYYQYYPADRVYVVVDKPDGADNVTKSKFDQVRLNDGSTLEGVFEGATDSTVTLLIGEKNHDININDIISINFAPSIQVQDTTQQK